MQPHPVTLWTARIFAAACVPALLLWCAGAKSPRRLRAWRLLWSGSWLLLLVHVLAAFHFEHAWSHQHAWEHTADQTARTLGLRFGAGLLFNELFLVWWATDVWRLAHRLDSIDSRFHRATVWLCVFMLFNATAVFGPRWWIVAAIPSVAAGMMLHRRHSKAGRVTDGGGVNR